MNIDQLHHIFINSTGICTDTRTLKPEQLFFALKGDNFNGNAFAKTALEQGAAYAIIDEAACAISGKTILVENVLTCLQNLAAHHLSLIHISEPTRPY